MSTYVIGDIQGCFNTFQALLKKISFDSTIDSLWLLGDVVNRGPDSLKVLRWIRDHNDHVKMILGNHEWHLLQVSENLSSLDKYDTLDDILKAPDREDLLMFLKKQPIVYQEKNFLFVHAGLLPRWTWDEALLLSKQISSILSSQNGVKKLLTSFKEKVFLKNLLIFLNIRTCDLEGIAVLSFKGQLDDMPSDLVPWFDHPNRKNKQGIIIFGHWAALGLYIKDDIICLDTGCIWGDTLTALCLEDQKIYKQKNIEKYSLSF